MIQCYYTKISPAIVADKFEWLMSFLPKEKQKQITLFQNDIDKKLSLYSDILVRLITIKTLNICNKKIVFGKNQYGKPFLLGTHDFSFNLSHTREAVIVAISDKPIGADIEKTRDAPLDIANRFFTINEQKYIKQASTNVDKRFYEIWTRKEAYIKYIGKGLAIPLPSFDVLEPDISPHIETITTDNYLISVCSEYVNYRLPLVELSESMMESLAEKLLS